MDKETYIQLRRQHNLTAIAYSYYRERGGNQDFQTLSKLAVFSMIDYDTLLKELDIRFELTLVTYNDNLINIT